MCDPASITAAVVGTVSVAVSAAAASAQASAVQKQQDATATAAMQAMKQQSDLEQQGNQLASQSLANNSTDATQQRLDAATQQRMGTQAQVASDMPNADMLSGQQTASQAVKNTISDKTAEAKASLATQALARAQLGAWGDSFTALSNQNSPLTERIGMLGSFASGDSATNQAALAQAKTAGAGEAALASGVAGVANGVASHSSSIGNTVGGWFSGSGGGATPAGSTGYTAPASYTGDTGVHVGGT